ncbi:MAG: trehalose-phosphatase [Candidatus Omnitrophota bacterium]
MKRYSFDGVVFDLDGVITKTALAHARAWKEAFDGYLRLREKRDSEPFSEFTHEDYLKYVDGKPRYKGVESFLESRGISISSGDPEDAPDKETVCGIGNRKNSAFNKVLDEEGVEVYSSTIEFIRRLKEAHIHVGVASSSKNCKAILKSAGIEDLFETRVDGEVSSRMGLKGKPEGDIFVTAAHNMKVEPGRAVVVEDAISGVQAGRNGGFGLVLGVARSNNTSELIDNGADAVVDDLEAIDMDWVEEWFHKEPGVLSCFWDGAKNGRSLDKQTGTKEGITLNDRSIRFVNEIFKGTKRLILFLDYDGSLTDIVDRPEDAVLSKDMKDALEKVSGKYTVAIVSGRMRKDVESLIGIKGIFYAGSHGFDIAGPGFSMVHPEAEGSVALIAKIAEALSDRLKDVSGILIDNKKFSVAVHYRLVDKRDTAKVEEAVKETLQEFPSLRFLSGKKVFEILPDINWDKGRALRWIMNALKLSFNESCVAYIGDDTTDECAFRALRTRGLGIIVSEKAQVSSADFRLCSVDEVKRLLLELIESK